MGNFANFFCLLILVGFASPSVAKAPTSKPISKPTTKPTSRPTSKSVYEFILPELGGYEEKALKRLSKKADGWTGCILQQEGGHTRQIYYFYAVFVKKGKYTVAPTKAKPNTFVLFNNTHASKKLADFFKKKRVVVTYYTQILGQRVLQKSGFSVMASERIWCMR